jgi:hypothetical protein
MSMGAMMTMMNTTMAMATKTGSGNDDDYN